MNHQILICHGVPSRLHLLGQGFVYQQKNDPKHTSKLCKNYLDKKEAERKLQKLDWPPQSPDLNPIEHLWDILDQNLSKSSTSSQHMLWEQLQAAWQNISEEISKKLVILMPERITVVIKAKGSHTKY